MKREFMITADGSHTIYVPELDEPYHSVHGAIQESRHVFLAEGFRMMHKSPLRVLEIGFGTGLNAILTLAEAGKSSIHTYYHAVEKYPLSASEFMEINYEQFVDGISPGSLIRMHTVPWGEWIRLTDHFILFKELADFREMDPQGAFDLVYFDAFAPKKQPHLWTEEIFCRLYQLVNPGGILVTYAAKGSVRRAMISCGFQVEKVPGPPGKREMIRAIKR
jgi:tRNA U34 5-methylaminomethyl-2-thiouridine-forming methyltransferase MnmC